MSLSLGFAACDNNGKERERTKNTKPTVAFSTKNPPQGYTLELVPGSSEYVVFTSSGVLTGKKEGAASEAVGDVQVRVMASNGKTPTGVSSVAKGMPRFYPNPVSHVLTFVNTDKVSIYAATGALIGVYTTATVSVAHLPAGVYMVTMQRGSYTKTAKLIKK
jgi:hypothetical protein